MENLTSLIARKVMGLGGEPVTLTLLNQHNSLFHSKHLSLYPQVINALIPSTKELLFAMDRDHYKKPQPINIENKCMWFLEATDLTTT